MKKQDLIPAIFLILLIPVWTWLSPKFFPQKPAPQPALTAPAADATAAPETTLEAAPAPAVNEPTAIALPPEEEITGTLTNSHIQLVTTSSGAGIKSATFLNYPKLDEKNSAPVTINFSAQPALTYEGLPGLSISDAVASTQEENAVTFAKALGNGITFKRRIAIDENYLITITDRFINSSTVPWPLPERRLLSGRMANPENIQTQRGIPILGVDSYTSSQDLFYWGRKLNGLYKNEGKPTALAVTPEDLQNVPMEWAAAKNKFFVQIIRPSEPIATLTIRSNAERNGKRIIPQDVAFSLNMPAEVIAPGSSRDMTYTSFLGPKKYAELKKAGHYMEGVMQFQTVGFFHGMNWLMEPARKAMLWTLNLFHAILPNYGIAIILLTVLVRILFWPLTHKSTESMKRMQEIQPLMKELQAKYKDKPQKLQQETMKLYKEHKVNPMGGCLPMFVQIPVFIALYTVLRNAIELRYEGFLWISDLSSPENLFAGHVPVVGALNILPLLNSATMFLQQKMTPTAPAATPEQQQQQKMMMVMMPIMMLFFFYKMPSGLVLYWTTSSLLMILQMSMRNMKKKKADA